MIFVIIIYSIVILSHAIFSTHGVFNNELLPLIYHSHTQKEHPTGTHKRYTVQALPVSTHLPPLSELYEVCCIRGFPDNIQAVAALFGIIWKDLSLNADCRAFSLLPIFHYSFSSRTQHSLRIFLDEPYLRIYSPHLSAQHRIQSSLNLLNHPISHSVLSWRDQIAKSFTAYAYSPTNIPSLIYNPTTLAMDQILVDMDSTIQLVLENIARTTPVGYIIRCQGLLDKPWGAQDDALLFVSELDDTKISYNLKKWRTDYPHLLSL